MESVVVLTSGKPTEIRKLLKGFPDGLSVNQIADVIGITVGDVRKKLAKMADAYIVSWTGEHPAALWSVADSSRDKPSNASRPRKAYETLRKLGIA
jgi:predicted ArsR family transcriptional regulator